MQLREMKKNIETIKQTLRSGEDTGSIKFLDDIQKLAGLVLQLKVKTGFIVTDDIIATVEGIVEGIISANQDKIEEIKAILNAEGKKQLINYIMIELRNIAKKKI
jgi:hypothetical protein